MKEHTRDTILLICTGNVCRSPMAAALVKHALAAEPEPIKSLRVESAGTAAIAGEKASANSVEALRPAKLSLGKHRSQSVSENLVNRAALIVGMTDSHLYSVQQVFPEVADRLILFREFLPVKQIPDPYGQNLAAYVEARDAMVEALPSLVKHIKSLYDIEEAS